MAFLELEEEYHLGRAQRRILERFNPFQSDSDKLFRQQFRFTKIGVQQLIEFIGLDLEPPSNKNNAIRPETKVGYDYTKFCYKYFPVVYKQCNNFRF